MLRRGQELYMIAEDMIQPYAHGHRVLERIIFEVRWDRCLGIRDSKIVGGYVNEWTCRWRCNIDRVLAQIFAEH